MKKAALIGNDVQHSLSPTIHSFFFKQHNIVGRYDCFSVTEQALTKTVESLVKEGYTGFNVTIPYKEKVITLLDDIDDHANKIGAVNTILIKEDKLIGYNTDSYGFIQGITSQIPNFHFPDITVLILGAGGAAKAVIHALIEQKVKKIYLANRTLNRSKSIRHKFPNVEIIRWQDRNNIIKSCDLIVNATPIATNIINTDLIKEDSVIYDLVYYQSNPIEHSKYKKINGLGMLIWQAELSFHLWFNNY